MKPAIVVVGYNRPHDLKRLLDSVNAAKYDDDNVVLVISLDKADNEAEVVAVAEAFDWQHGEKIIRTFPERQGLRKHVIQCGDLSEIYDAVIILEDDLVVSPNFYLYTQQALEFYQDSKKVTGVALYSHEWNGYARRSFSPVADSYDVYMGQYSITWGQCWTKKWWSGFKSWYLEHEGKLGINLNIPMGINHWSAQSWGRYFVNYIVEQDLYYVIPRIALSTNCSDVGQHVREADATHQVRLLHSADKKYHFAPFEDAHKYDIFFENRQLQSFLPDDIDASQVCINLSGIQRDLSGFQYVLTTNDMPYHCLKTWGLVLRPIDMNIIMDIPGKEIKLYHLRQPQKCKTDTSYEMMRYEVKGFNFREMRKYAWQLNWRAIKSKLKRLLGKK